MRRTEKKNRTTMGFLSFRSYLSIVTVFTQDNFLVEFIAPFTLQSMG